MAEVAIPESERRQNHISEIDPSQPLLQVALDCLRDEDIERPSAQQLCERVAALKGDPQYRESMIAIEARSTAEQSGSDERDRELRSLRQQHSKQVRGLQQIIQSQISRLDKKERALRHQEETMAAEQQLPQRKINENHQLIRERDQVIEEKERIERQLEESGRVI